MSRRRVLNEVVLSLLADFIDDSADPVWCSSREKSERPHELSSNLWDVQ